MTADLSALIARLEAAEVGDQDLSLEVNITLEGGEPVGKMANYVMEPYWAIRRPNPAYVGGFENGPNHPVTTSLDAALSLAERVLPGWYFGVQQNRYVSPDMPDNWSAYLSAPRALDQGDIEGEAPTPALALCIAILRAKQGEAE